jgi:hypothetical protein
VAQRVPAAQLAFDNVDWDSVLRTTWYNQNASMSSLISSEDVEETRMARAQQEAQAKQQAAIAEGAQAYAMGTKAPEEGSASQALMEQAGG